MFPELNLRIVELAKYVGDPYRAEVLARRWGMSSDDEKQLVFLCGTAAATLPLYIIKRLVALGTWTAQGAVNILAVNDRWEDYETLRKWEIPAFPITGNDVMCAFDLKPGPEVGRKLAQLRAVWASSDYTLTRDQLLPQQQEL